MRDNRPPSLTDAGRDSVAGSAAGEPSIALRAESFHLHTITDQLPAMVGYWNKELRCEYANNAYIEWFGVAPQKVIGMRMVDLLGEKLFRLNEPYIRLALSGRAQRFERKLLKADGTHGYTDARYIPDPDAQGTIRGFFVLVADITELHQAYERVRELAQRLESAREDERRSVAKSLHEGIAQDLFAAALALKNLKSQLARGEDVSDAASEVGALIDTCIAHTRQVASALHPPAVDDVPLLRLLQSHARYIESLSDIRVRVREVGAFPTLDESIRLIFFRAAQEAITNVLRHAQARNVDIALRAEPETLYMQIGDDGIGMDMSALGKLGSLGLLGMRERFESIGGSLLIERNLPSGTLLVLRLPYPTQRP